METMKIHEMPPAFGFGQVKDLEGGTGCTVILCPDGAVAGVDVRGGSPGTRDTDALNPVCNREVVHGVVLTRGQCLRAGCCRWRHEKAGGRGHWPGCDGHGGAQRVRCGPFLI